MQYLNGGYTYRLDMGKYSNEQLQNVRPMIITSVFRVRIDGVSQQWLEDKFSSDILYKIYRLNFCLNTQKSTR